MQVTEEDLPRLYKDELLIDLLSHVKRDLLYFKHNGRYFTHDRCYEAYMRREIGGEKFRAIGESMGKSVERTRQMTHIFYRLVNGMLAPKNRRGVRKIAENLDRILDGLSIV